MGILWALLAGQSAPCAAGEIVSRIEDPQDDATEHNGAVYPLGLEAGVGCLGRDAKGGAFTAAFRFHVPDLARGQTVAFARLRISCTEDIIPEALSLIVRATAEDQPAPCSQERPPSHINTTASSVSWRIAPSRRTDTRFFYRTSPNLASVINEVTSRPGWGAQVKTILLVVQPDTAGAPVTGRVKFQDFAGADRRRSPAILEIFPVSDDVFTGGVMLGRPTDSSVTLNALSLLPIDLVVDYCPVQEGDGPGELSTADQVRAGPAKSLEVVLPGLRPDCEYGYRTSWRLEGEHDFRAGPTGRFHTQRAEGSSFVFTIQADSHLGTAVPGRPGRGERMYASTLANVAADSPDFHIDLGDFARLEVVGRRSAATLEEARERYAHQRHCLADLSRNAPFFLALGNHEGEQGWRTGLPRDSLPEWGVQARRQTIPNPYPDRFYSGNPDSVAGGPVENYYAWQWGDALFVVLDPFRYTMRLPHGVGWRGQPVSDGWAWTLGAEQYQWLYRTLHESNARWKFVFAHHMTGGIVEHKRGRGAYGRGGVDAAAYRVAHRASFEWGGEDSTGAFVFEAQRPGWQHGPIHRMMKEEGVDIFFRGHDHTFVHEKLDGVVYQTCPIPIDRKYSRGFFEPRFFTTGEQANNMGHLRVAVSSDSVRVDYVRSVLPEDEPLRENGIEVRNGSVSYTYTLRK
jgi:hypothetical protein